MPALQRSSLPLALLGGALLACGSPPPAAPHQPQRIPEEIDSPAETVAAPITELSRAQVMATVDAKLPVFLQKFEVAATLVDGKFTGWRIVRFTHPEEWRGVGLAPGDVVQRINDQPIEREDQAYAVFVSLRTAKSLDVAYERDGQPMRLSLPIVGDAPPAAAPQPSPAGDAPGSAGKPGTEPAKPAKK